MFEMKWPKEERFFKQHFKKTSECQLILLDLPLSIRKKDFAQDLLEKANVVVLAVKAFGVPGYVRFSFGNKEM